MAGDRKADSARRLDVEAQKALAELKAKLAAKKRPPAGPTGGTVAGMPESVDESDLLATAVRFGRLAIDQLGTISIEDYAKALIELVGPDIIPYVAPSYSAIYMTATKEQRAEMTPLDDVADLTEDQIRKMGGEEEATEEQAPEEVPEEEAEPISQTRRQARAARKAYQELRRDIGSEHQLAYHAKSTGEALGTFTPKEIASALGDALDTLEESVEDVSEFVRKKLDYSSVRSLQDVMSSEQIDAVAMAIHAYEDGKSAIVLGDQTGVGKGRVNAAMLRYARLAGLTPIFYTASPNLYADIVRDLVAIGEYDVENPPAILITNGDIKGANTILTDGDPIKSFAGHSAVLKSATIGRGGKIVATVSGEPKQFDYLFTTYDQMNTMRGVMQPRHALIGRAAESAFLVLDEVHNASGQEGVAPSSKSLPRSIIMRWLIKKAKGVFYSSATFAKRPGTMDLYLRTNLRLAFSTVAQMATAFDAGGLPMQQIAAQMLAEDGQYLRREHSLKGITLDLKRLDDPRTYNRTVSISGSSGDIFDIDIAMAAVIKRLVDEARPEGSSSGAEGLKTGDHASFASVLHNLVASAILSSKVDAVVDSAVQAHKDGQKPVITLFETKESFISDAADALGIRTGQPFVRKDGEPISMADLFLRYLRRTRAYKTWDINPATGQRENVQEHWVSDAELEAEAPQILRNYNRARDLILADENLRSMPISPIDTIKQALEKQGISIGEITGRSRYIDYSDPKNPVLRNRPASETGPRGKQITLQQFNGKGGKHTDALLFNTSGSTGLSAHASPETGEDLRQRHMIVAQPMPNIDSFMQALGRVNRTGQVNTPLFTLVMSDMPMEQRPMAVLLKKLASLNANTTGATKGDISFEGVPDLMNSVGDRVAFELMQERDDLFHALRNPIDRDDDVNIALAARRVTGRAILLTLEEQQELYDQLADRFQAMIDHLNEIGKNPLNAAVIDFQAIESGSPEVAIVKKGATSSVFDQAATLKEFNVTVQGDPQSSREVFNGLLDTLDAHQAWKDASEKPIADLLNLDVADARLIPAERRFERQATDLESFVKTLTPADLTPALFRIRDAMIREQGVAHAGALKDQIQRDFDEWLAAEIGDYEATLRKQGKDEPTVAIRLAQRRQALESTLPVLRAFLDGWTIGTPVAISNASDDEVHYGIISKIERRGKTKNPAALGSWHVDVAVVGPRRKATFTIHMATHGGNKTQVQLAELRDFEIFNAYRQESIVEAYDAAPKDKIERRWIVTGNLVGARGEEHLPKGQWIFFTKFDGSIERGILMPKSFSPQRLSERLSQRHRFTTAKEVMDALWHPVTTIGAKLVPSTRGKGYVPEPVPRQGMVIFMTDRTKYHFRVPAKKGAAAPFISSTAINEAIGGSGFVKGRSANYYEFVTRNQAHAIRVIQAVLDEGFGLEQDFGVDTGEVGGSPEGPRGGAPPPAQLPPPSNRPRLLQPKAIRGTKQVTAEQIVKFMERVSGSPFHVGHGSFRQLKAAGWYSRATRGVRLKEARNLNTAAHEFGHALHDRILPGMKLVFSPAANKELIRLGKSLYGARKPSFGYAREGLAEYVAMTLWGEHGETIAPEFHKWWMGMLAQQENSDLRNNWTRLRRMFAQYDAQGALGRVMSQIHGLTDTPWDKIKSGFARLQAALARIPVLYSNEAAQFEKVAKKLRRAIEQATGNELRPSANPARVRAALKMGFKGTARAFIRDGIVSPARGFTLMEGKSSLKQVLAPVSHRRSVLKRFIAFAYARRAVLLWQRNINPGISYEDALWVMRELESDVFLRASNGLTDWSNGLIDYVVEAGGLSPEAAAAMRALNPIYLPLKRYFDEYQLGGKAGTGRGVVNLPSPIKGIKGSTRPILHPIDMLVQQAKHMIAFGNKVMVARAMVEMTTEAQYLATKGTLDPRVSPAWFMTKVPPPVMPHSFHLGQIAKELEQLGVDLNLERFQSKKDRQVFLDQMMTVFTNAWSYGGKQNIVSIWINGQRTWWELNPEAYKVLTDMDKEHLPAILNFLVGGPKRIFQLFAIGLDPNFALAKNPVRDTVTGPIYSRRGLAIPGLWTLAGARHIIRDDDIAKRFRAAGVEMASLMGQDMAAARRAWKEAVATGTLEKGAMILRHPLDAARRFFGAFENAPRTKAFANELKHAEKQWGKNTLDASIEAILAAKGNTVNFTRGGIIGEMLNSVTAFINPQIQGAALFYRVFTGQDDGGFARAFRATALAISYVTLPQFMIWLVYRDDKWYQALPGWRKFGFYNLRAGDTTVSIPGPFELMWVFSLPIAMLDAERQKDPKLADEAMWNTIRSFLPVGNVAELLPNAIRPSVEVMLNRKTWPKVRDIDPFYDVQGKLPKNRYDTWTTQTARDLGEWLSVSPRKIEHWIRGHFASVGLGTLVKIDALRGIRNAATERQADRMPVVGAFTPKAGPGQQNRYVEEFYDDRDLMRQKRGSKEITRAEYGYLRRLEQSADRIAKVRDAYQAGKLPADRADEIITAAARAALKTKPQ